MSKFSLFDKGRGGQAEVLSSQFTRTANLMAPLSPKVLSKTQESAKDLTCFLPHLVKFRENPWYWISKTTTSHMEGPF